MVVGSYAKCISSTGVLLTFVDYALSVQQDIKANIVISVSVLHMWGKKIFLVL